MKSLIPLLILLVMAGCGPWVRTDGAFTSDKLNFSVELPEGWMRRNIDKSLMITRDGMLLQRIVVNRMSLDSEKQFEYTKKRITSGMLPQELAEVVLDDFQANTDNVDFTVEENVPATMAGMPGFKVRFDFRTPKGLHYQCAYYGFLSGDSLYEIFYLAPRRYYFDKDLATFEKVVKSFRLAKG